MSSPFDGLVDAIASAVANAVADRLPESLPFQAQKPALLDRQGLARELGISEPTVARLVKEGLPVIRIHSAVRFDLRDCLAWLKSHQPSARQADARGI
jgi:hypothetical protein